VRVAIIDDHRLCGEGLRAWLTAHVPEVSVVHVGSEPRGALELVDSIDVVLLDLELGAGAPPAAQSVEAFIGSGVQVILLTGAIRGNALREALLAGAGGYVTKAAQPVELVRLLEQVSHGEYRLTPEFAAALSSVNAPELSAQELRALQLYSQGLTLRQVSHRMSVSHYTAKEYLDRVRAKYQALGRTVRTKAQLQAAARQDGLLEL